MVGDAAGSFRPRVCSRKLATIAAPRQGGSKFSARTSVVAPNRSCPRGDPDGVGRRGSRWERGRSIGVVSKWSGMNTVDVRRRRGSRQSCHRCIDAAGATAVNLPAAQPAVHQHGGRHERAG